ncbi:hypothetical protein [Vibrio palustris]|uniref:Uncharacterized protein n=1 Tax=Vibrio palustris TaxID=1918946 RepID=A0A1R4B7U2_9VIBR|nr:hypothetical protein [Vibrio palustris]SJL84956.1 hypothetical protein VPAL9027_02968 [Vibrio palustris]
MLNSYVVRLAVISLLVLAIAVNPLYTLPMLVLLNTHYQEFFGH